MATNIGNPEQGEVDLHVKDKDGNITKTYVLKVSMKAGRALQQKHKKPFGQIVASLDQLDLDSMQELAFAVLQKHHSDQVKTPDDAGEVIDEAGGIIPFATAFKALMGLKDEDGKGTENPPTAQSSTTGASTSTPVAPA